MMSNDNYIYTDRLILRPFIASDINAYTDIMTDQLVTQYLGSRKKLTCDDVVNKLNRLISFYEKNGFGVWAVVLKDTHELIGQCGYMPIDNTDDVELLFAYTQKHWNKGYAKEAALAAISYAKRNYNWSRIVSMAYIDNIASNCLIQKLGFVYDKEIEMHGGVLNYYKIHYENENTE